MTPAEKPRLMDRNFRLVRLVKNAMPLPIPVLRPAINVSRKANKTLEMALTSFLKWLKNFLIHPYYSKGKRACQQGAKPWYRRFFAKETLLNWQKVCIIKVLKYAKLEVRGFLSGRK